MRYWAKRGIFLCLSFQLWSMSPEVEASNRSHHPESKGIRQEASEGEQTHFKLDLFEALAFAKGPGYLDEKVVEKSSHLPKLSPDALEQRNLIETGLNPDSDPEEILKKIQKTSLENRAEVSREIDQTVDELLQRFESLSEEEKNTLRQLLVLQEALASNGTSLLELGQDTVNSNGSGINSEQPTDTSSLPEGNSQADTNDPGTEQDLLSRQPESPTLNVQGVSEPSMTAQAESQTKTFERTTVIPKTNNSSTNTSRKSTSSFSPPILTALPTFTGETRVFTEGFFDEPETSKNSGEEKENRPWEKSRPVNPLAEPAETISRDSVASRKTETPAQEPSPKAPLSGFVTTIGKLPQTVFDSPSSTSIALAKPSNNSTVEASNTSLDAFSPSFSMEDDITTQTEATIDESSPAESPKVEFTGLFQTRFEELERITSRNEKSEPQKSVMGPIEKKGLDASPAEILSQTAAALRTGLSELADTPAKDTPNSQQPLFSSARKRTDLETFLAKVRSSKEGN